MFKDINIKIIPHGCMRDASQFGDYWVDENGALQIRVSAYADLRDSRDIAIHELLEAWRCAERGVSFAEIDQFDLDHTDHPDPGLLSTAPYHAEHMLSMDVEYLISQQDGRDFSEVYAHTPLGVDP
jgi:hypothetical protein